MKTGFGIFLWAAAGFFVSAGWGFYFAGANKEVPIGLLFGALARLTQPTAAVDVYFHSLPSLGLHWVEIANAITYSVIGLIVQTIRRRSQIIPMA